MSARDKRLWETVYFKNKFRIKPIMCSFCSFMKQIVKKINYKKLDKQIKL